jgi:indole-3-glycerol phosphate synthase
MTILDDIVSKKKTKLPQIITNSSDYSPKPFLNKGSFQVIAEIKRGSPSLGNLKPDLNVIEQSSYYEGHGAAAISVLTEEDFFFGSLGDLDKVRKAVSLPLLRKDFMISESQIIESKSHGADAILLICAILNEQTLHSFHSLATSLGLSVLVEVHNESEIDMALRCEARIIGINNRDLRTFKTDITHSIRLSNSIPDHIIKVSESGIKTSDDVTRLKGEGFDAILVGEAFVRDRELLREVTG